MDDDVSLTDHLRSQFFDLTSIDIENSSAHSSGVGKPPFLPETINEPSSVLHDRGITRSAPISGPQSCRDGRPQSMGKASPTTNTTTESVDSSSQPAGSFKDESRPIVTNEHNSRIKDTAGIDVLTVALHRLFQSEISNDNDSEPDSATDVSHGSIRLRD